MENVLFYEQCTEKTIGDLINIFKEQFPTSSKWSLEEVEISEIIPLCKHVYNERLNFAKTSILDCIQ